MPTKREREYYRMGFADGQRSGVAGSYNVEYAKLFEEKDKRRGGSGYTWGGTDIEGQFEDWRLPVKRKPKRKLSAWNKFVKANSRKKEFRYRDGKLNLKKMGVAFRRKKRR